jgi:hypothetical protein
MNKNNEWVDCETYEVKDLNLNRGWYAISIQYEEGCFYELDYFDGTTFTEYHNSMSRLAGPFKSECIASKWLSLSEDIS